MLDGFVRNVTVLPFSKPMRQTIVTTIVVVLLAGCRMPSSKQLAESQSSEIDAKAVTETAKVEVPDIAIDRAAWKGDVETIQKHLLAGTAVDTKNKWGSTALHYAARGGQGSVAELLISKNANVNEKDADGMTPLHLAASAGHEEVAKLFIASGADVKARGGERKEAPLFSAVKKSRENIVELLLANGADINVKDAHAETSLDSAVKNGFVGMVELLVVNGANVNGDGGTTPLHKAASTGQKEIVELLLSNGANVNVTIAFGDTPLDWAVRNKKEKIVAILRKHGGKTGEELEDEGK